jgi:hypothetical protein
MEKEESEMNKTKRDSFGWAETTTHQYEQGGLFSSLEKKLSTYKLMGWEFGPQKQCLDFESFGIYRPQRFERPVQ